MARLQILELPEGSGDDRPPFVLVIDRAPRDEPLYQMFRGNLDLTDSLADQIGARAVLVFEETIDIPANDTTAYLGSGSGSGEQEIAIKLGNADLSDQDIRDIFARATRSNPHGHA